jgi:segregation and condensation protein B
MTNEERKAALEAIIYAADEPATLEQLAAALGDEKLAVQSSLDELMADYGNESRGIEIREVAGGFKLYTKPQQHDVVRRFIKSLRPPLRLTMPALETLAVISYKQPVTAPEIAEIRGVNTSGVLKTLLDKRLITTAGRKEVIGRPILYRTSKEFLMRFGLSDLQELPSLKEFEALAREALGSDEGVAIPDELPTDVQDEVLDAAENIADLSGSTPSSVEDSTDPGQTGRFPYRPSGTSESQAAETSRLSHPQTQTSPTPNVSESRPDPFVDAFASKLHGASTQMLTENANTQPGDEIVAIVEDEKVPPEVAATNEGMPAGVTDAAPIDAEEVQHPEAFDADQLNDHSTENNGTKRDEAKGAVVGE